jgi:hypothetical protein
MLTITQSFDRSLLGSHSCRESMVRDQVIYFRCCGLTEGNCGIAGAERLVSKSFIAVHRPLSYDRVPDHLITSDELTTR